MTTRSNLINYSEGGSAALAGAADGHYLPARKVWERYGVTSMTLFRWIRNERTGFPKPTYFGRFRYWRLSDLLAWERECAKGRGDNV